MYDKDVVSPSERKPVGHAGRTGFAERKCVKNASARVAFAGSRLGRFGKHFPRGGALRVGRLRRGGFGSSLSGLGGFCGFCGFCGLRRALSERRQQNVSRVFHHGAHLAHPLGNLSRDSFDECPTLFGRREVKSPECNEYENAEGKKQRPRKKYERRSRGKEQQAPETPNAGLKNRHAESLRERAGAARGAPPKGP